jgi:hypothetical protein
LIAADFLAMAERVSRQEQYDVAPKAKSRGWMWPNESVICIASANSASDPTSLRFDRYQRISASTRTFSPG